MGKVTGIAAAAGLAAEAGSVPGIGRVLLVDSIAAAVGGFVGVSSNTTYIESAAGVAEGGRTGFTAVVTGVLFLLAILLSPLAGLVAGVATAPALVLVGNGVFSTYIALRMTTEGFATGSIGISVLRTVFGNARSSTAICSSRRPGTIHWSWPLVRSAATGSGTRTVTP